MAGVGPISQDWEPVVIRKKAPNAAAKKDEKAVNAARRSGAEIETVKKSNAGTNKASSSSVTLNTRKLDDETENLSHILDLEDIELGHSVNFWCPDALDERVSTELKKNIMQGRIGKKLTQAQLAQLINEKPQVIQEYESGKAIPNQQIIVKLERVLSVKLRGKK
ncbi:Multiprotein-bridging factor 1b [Asimina triloba]